MRVEHHASPASNACLCKPFRMAAIMHFRLVMDFTAHQQGSLSLRVGRVPEYCKQPLQPTSNAPRPISEKAVIDCTHTLGQQVRAWLVIVAQKYAFIEHFWYNTFKQSMSSSSWHMDGTNSKQVQPATGVKLVHTLTVKGVHRVHRSLIHIPGFIKRATLAWSSSVQDNMPGMWTVRQQQRYGQAYQIHLSSCACKSRHSCSSSHICTRHISVTYQCSWSRTLLPWLSCT